MVIAITETWLSDILSSVYSLPGYMLETVNCQSTGSGVGIYVADTLSYVKRNDLCRMTPHFECIFLEIQLNGKSNIILGSVYRPSNPVSNNLISKFVEDLTDISIILSNVDSAKMVYIAGDFKIDLLNCHHNNEANEFLTVLLSFSHIPAVTKPTRITQCSATLLDNIFGRSRMQNINTAIIYSDISDHLPVPIHCCNETGEIPKKEMIIQNEHLMTFQLKAFTNFYQINIWPDFYHYSSTVNDVEKAFDPFPKIYTNAFEFYFPKAIKKINCKFVPAQEWMTARLVRSCNKRSRLCRNAKNRLR